MFETLKFAIKPAINDNNLVINYFLTFNGKINNLQRINVLRVFFFHRKDSHKYFMLYWRAQRRYNVTQSQAIN